MPVSWKVTGGRCVFPSMVPARFRRWFRRWFRHGSVDGSVDQSFRCEIGKFGRFIKKFNRTEKNRGSTRYTQREKKNLPYAGLFLKLKKEPFVSSLHSEQETVARFVDSGPVPVSWKVARSPFRGK